jgi:hypothetical protein
LILLEQGQRQLRICKAYSSHAVENQPVEIKVKNEVKPLFPITTAQRSHIISFAVNEQEATIGMTTSHGLMYFFYIDGV